MVAAVSTEAWELEIRRKSILGKGNSQTPDLDRPYMTGLDTILERLGLSQYLQAFLDEGFDTWDTLMDVTESDLYEVSPLHLYRPLTGWSETHCTSS